MDHSLSSFESFSWVARSLPICPSRIIYMDIGENMPLEEHLCNLLPSTTSSRATSNRKLSHHSLGSNACDIMAGAGLRGRRFSYEEREIIGASDAKYESAESPAFDVQIFA